MGRCLAGTKTISARGTFVLPRGTRVRKIELRAFLVKGGVPFARTLKPSSEFDPRNGTWNLSRAAIPSGTYVVFAIIRVVDARGRESMYNSEVVDSFEIP